MITENICCNCRFYEGVKGAQGCAPCKANRKMTIWNDSCEKIWLIPERLTIVKPTEKDRCIDCANYLVGDPCHLSHLIDEINDMIENIDGDFPLLDFNSRYMMERGMRMSLMIVKALQKERGGENVTAIEKRKLLEFIDRCVRYDLLSDTDVNKILDICGAAVDRSIKKVKESE